MSRVDELNASMRRQFEAEQKTQQQLLKLENEFREHYALTLREIQTQKEFIDRLWVLSQRYIIIVTTGPCCKHPEVYSSPTEDVLLHEYNEKLKMLRASNCRLMQSLHAVRLSCRVFEHLSAQLDMTCESPFILGDTFHKPIGFFIELVADLFKYFHALTLKFKYRAHQLDPYDSLALEEYKLLLVPSEDFEEYLMNGLTYCKCLRPKPKCHSVKAPKVQSNLNCNKNSRNI